MKPCLKIRTKTKLKEHQGEKILRIGVKKSHFVRETLKSVFNFLLFNYAFKIVLNYPL